MPSVQVEANVGPLAFVDETGPSVVVHLGENAAQTSKYAAQAVASAAAAASSETNAATSETNAADSETAAATSETNAAASEAAAQAAQAAAETAESNAEAIAGVTAENVSNWNEAYATISRGFAGKLFGLAETPKAGVAVQRGDVSYDEYAIYHALDADGAKWARISFGNKLLGNSDGAPVMRVATLAYLYSSTAVTAPAGNHTTGTYETAPVSSQTPADATDTGTWTSPATVGGVTTVSYAASGSGATREYSYSLANGDSKIFELRGYVNNTNGGTGKVTIEVDSVEISAGEYLAILESGERIVRYASSGSYATGLTHIPVAEISNSSGSAQTITILIEEATGNSGRVYDAGLNIYDSIAYNDVTSSKGLHTLGKTNASLGGVSSLEIPNPGGTIVYELTDTTRVNWDYLALSNGGEAGFTVYDNAGSEIGTYLNETVDTYSSSTQVRRICVAEGLTKGTYYLHIRGRSSKNASAGNYRLYDIGALGQDESTPGTLGSDTFDIQDISVAPSDGTNLSEHILYGPQNMECALELIDSASSFTTSEVFATGTHRNETGPSNFAVTIDGVDQTTAFNALSEGDFLYGTKNAEVSFDTTLDTDILSDGSGSTGTPLATLNYKQKVDRWGWHPEVTVTLTANAKMRMNYILMLQAIGSAATLASGIENRGEGGGFSLMGFDAGDDHDFAALSESASETARSPAIVTANDSWAVIATLDNLPEVLSAFDGVMENDHTRRGYVRTNGNGYLKGYTLLAGQTNETDGFSVSSGLSWTMRRTIRVVEGDYRDVLGMAA